ncbi:MAG: U32 family peptidase [Candidatus Gracilibacteria bacterium]|nr:U32 family peptidase [Candidatus Gracilibacteria bacterium]
MFKKIVGLGFQSKGKNAKDVKEYINLLIENGANEFMTGYNPQYWFEKFGFEVSPNGRFAEHEQITDYETLKDIVEEIHNNKLEIFVNLNAWYYTIETFPLIKKMIGELISLNFDGIICGNIEILEYLKEINYKGKINLSTILALYNKESIRFFIENYRINKVILSREVTLKEIEELVTEFKEIKFEVFGEGDFCRYNNGLCYAEHKYGNKDICTVVINELIIKKRFNPEYKKLILNNELTNNEKTKLINESFKDDFYYIKKTIDNIELGFIDKNNGLKEIEKLIIRQKDNISLYYDSMKNLEDKQNKKVLNVLKGINYLLNNNYAGENLNTINELKNELEASVKSGISFNLEKQNELGGETKVNSIELANLYGKSDILNLYSYLFFLKFQNIETVKFPTRGRTSLNKIKIIDELIKKGEINNSILNRSISIKRTHYDLTHIFGEKLRFRKLLSNFYK